MLCLSIPQEMKDIYKTVWEIKMKTIIDLASERGAFVDQSQASREFPSLVLLSPLVLRHPPLFRLSSLVLLCVTLLQRQTTGRAGGSEGHSYEVIDLNLSNAKLGFILCFLENRPDGKKRS